MLPKDWDKVNQLSENLVKNTLSRLDLKAENKTAVFDADGTLWDTDMGEDFFRYQIKHCHLPGLPKDPWQSYEDKKDKDYAQGCLWLAQINAGQTLKQVQQWAEEFYLQSEPVPIFENIKHLVQKLQQLNFKIYIVTASIKWAVEPGARRLGIPESHVLGMETEVQNNIITEKGIEPLTYAEGKAKAFLKRVGSPPQLAAGNSSGDIALLKSATNVSIAFRTQTPDMELFKSEERLQQVAAERNWLWHCYR